VIAALKPYAAYKDSGVPWLGNVPEHWQLPRLGALLRERGETNDDERAINVLSVLRERGVIPYDEKGNIGNKKSEDITRYKIVRPDDIVVNCMNIIIGSVGLSRYTGCLSPVYYVLTRRSESDDPRYLNAYFQTKPFQRSLVRIGNGILAHRMRIPMELLKCELFPRPPLPEQAAIVRFLDHADRRIRRHILAKQKLIKLLEEQKQAIIHRAVTRGLDPNVRLKSSGVEWLGEVPASWDRMLLGRCLKRIDQGWSPLAAEGGISPDQWAVLTLSSVKRGAFNAAAIKPLSVSAKVPDGIEIRDGDLLLTRSNTRELVGDVCVVKGARQKTVLCDLIFRLVVDPTRLDRRFLMYQLLSPVGRTQIERDARGSSGTMPKISQRHIRSWVVIAPSPPEQLSLVEAIEDAVAMINNAARRAERAISLLREYRTRLIADVVTGKLDVREVAAELPEEEESLVDKVDGVDEDTTEVEDGDDETESDSS
jgi:type I restriction enzyme S subunit